MGSVKVCLSPWSGQKPDYVGSVKVCLSSWSGQKPDCVGSVKVCLSSWSGQKPDCVGSVKVCLSPWSEQEPDGAQPAVTCQNTTLPLVLTVASSVVSFLFFFSSSFLQAVSFFVFSFMKSCWYLSHHFTCLDVFFWRQSLLFVCPSSLVACVFIFCLPVFIGGCVFVFLSARLHWWLCFCFLSAPLHWWLCFCFLSACLHWWRFCSHSLNLVSAGRNRYEDSTKDLPPTWFMSHPTSAWSSCSTNWWPTLARNHPSPSRPKLQKSQTLYEFFCLRWISDSGQFSVFLVMYNLFCLLLVNSDLM